MCPQTTPSTTNAASFVSAKLPNAMSRDQLGFCTSVVRNLKRNKKAHPFLEPVDPIKLNIPHYHTIVKQPMDLGTVEQKLANNGYADVEAFCADVRQIFQNCYLFNGRESPYSAMAAALEKAFENQIKRLPAAPADTSQHPPGSARRVSTGPSTGHSYAGIAMPPPAGSRQSAATFGRSLGPTSSHLEQPEAATGGPKAASAQKKPSSFRYTGSAAAGSASSDRRLTFCSSVLHELSKKTHAGYSHPFMQPVDHVALAIPDYPQIIKRPMDLSTIRRKHDAGEYASYAEFEDDIKLMFNNCFTYNKPGDPVYVMGKQLEQVFFTRWKDLPPPPVKTKNASPAKPASSKTASST
ncbi:MAG: Bromodomain-containing protein, partial [Olpidium bornovanus]